MSLFRTVTFLHFPTFLLRLVRRSMIYLFTAPFSVSAFSLVAPLTFISFSPFLQPAKMFLHFIPFIQNVIVFQSLLFLHCKLWTDLINCIFISFKPKWLVAISLIFVFQSSWNIQCQLGRNFAFKVKKNVFISSLRLLQQIHAVIFFCFRWTIMLSYVLKLIFDIEVKKRYPLRKKKTETTTTTTSTNNNNKGEKKKTKMKKTTTKKNKKNKKRNSERRKKRKKKTN